VVEEKAWAFGQPKNVVAKVRLTLEQWQGAGQDPERFQSVVARWQHSEDSTSMRAWTLLRWRRQRPVATLCHAPYLGPFARYPGVRDCEPAASVAASRSVTGWLGPPIQNTPPGLRQRGRNSATLRGRSKPRDITTAAVVSPFRLDSSGISKSL